MAANSCVSLRRFLSFLLVAGVLAAAAPVRAQDEKKFEAYLERFGLTDLHVIYLEKELARPNADARQAAAARKLADLYAAQLLAASDPKVTDDIKSRIRTLIKNHPHSNTLSLQVMLLEGDFNRAETLAEKWLGDAADRQAREEARQILARLLPAFKDLQTKTQALVKQLSDELDRTSDRKRQEQKDQELSRASGYAAKVLYLQGWANYYAGRLKDGVAKAEFTAGRDAFRKILDVENVVEEGDLIEKYDLESEGRARAALGLGLCEMAGGDADAGQKWFNLVRDPRVGPEVREEAASWIVRALVFAGQIGKAREFAEKEIASFSDAPTPSKGAFCLVLIQVGHGGEKPQPEIGLLGIRGLLKMRQFNQARKAMDRYRIVLDDKKSFLGLWLTAQNLFDKAERSKALADYQKAAEEFQKALDAPDARTEPQLAVEARYTLAWSFYQSNELEKAAAEFKNAAGTLQSQKAALAADAAWMTAVAYHRLAGKDARYKLSAIEAFTAFKENFPDHANAKKVEYQISKLKQDITALEKVGPDDQGYAEACLELSRRDWKLWKQANADAARGAAAARQLRTQVDKYLALPAEKVTPLGKLECLLMLADLALAAKPPDVKAAQEHLTPTDELAKKLEAGDVLAGDYHFKKLLLAEATRDEPSVLEHARWLAEHSRGTPYEEPALVALARHADAAVAQAKDRDRAEAVGAALALYRRLLDVLDDSPERLKANKNALIACSRVATYALEAGRLEEAARQADKLLAVHPKDAKFLRIAGLAHFGLGKYERALECWRPLANGLPKDGDGWFEAKYHQIACLARTDAGQAKKEFTQLKQQHANLGPEPWRSEFQKLRKSLE